MDQILIEGLTINTIVGIHPWERESEQPIILDITLDFPIQNAAASDSIDDALNYQSLCDMLTTFVEASRFYLIETLADQCIQKILASYPAERVKLKVNKPQAIDNANNIAIIVSRSRTSKTNLTT